MRQPLSTETALSWSMCSRASTAWGGLRERREPNGPTSHTNAKRGPGRRAKQTASINGLDGILQAVQNSERERAEMRKALERIQTLVSSVLSG